MALSHIVCGAVVNRYCLKTADGTSYWGGIYLCSQCLRSVLFGEIAGTSDGSTDVYAMSFPSSLGTSGQPLTSTGGASAPAFATLTGGFQYFDTKQYQTTALPTNARSTILAFSNSVPAAALNVLKRRLRVEGAGVFTTAVAEIPTLQFEVFLLGSSRISVTTGALTASLTDKPFRFEFEFQTTNTGGSGALSRSGLLHIYLNGIVNTTLLTADTTGVPVIDLTQVINPVVTLTPSTSLTSITVGTAVTYVM